MILIKTSCPWGGGGGRICFGRNGENLFGGDGKNIWEKPGVKMIWWGGGEEELFPQPPKKIRSRGEELASAGSAGELYTFSKVISRKLCFVIRIFLFQLMQII